MNVNRVSLRPSASTTNISAFPSSARTKAIRLPSRDQAGSVSFAGSSVSWARLLLVEDEMEAGVVRLDHRGRDAEDLFDAFSCEDRSGSTAGDDPASI